MTSQDAINLEQAARPYLEMAEEGLVWGRDYQITDVGGLIYLFSLCGLSQQYLEFTEI